jgi:putative endopeptidase
MTAPTVNAYYNPSVNEIVFPAGILQRPAFDPDADDAFNYGSAGATIGHEISHGFDDQGSQYDSDGNLRDWWTPEDHAKFKAKTEQLIKESALRHLKLFELIQEIARLHVAAM